MPEVREVIKDPEFLNLPVEEKRKVLINIDPDFSKLAGQEQNKVLSQLNPEKPKPNLLQSIGQGVIEGLPYATAALAEIPGATAMPVTGGQSVWIAPTLGYLGGTYIRDFAKQQPLIRKMLGYEEPPPTPTLQSELTRTGESLLQGGLSYLTRPLAATIAKGLGPWASSMTPEQLKVAEEAAKYGMSISPKEYSPSKLAGIFQAMSDWFPSGRIWSQHKRGNILQGMKEMQDKLIEDASSLAEQAPGETKELLLRRIQDYLKSLPQKLKAEAKEKGYQQFKQILGDENVGMPETTKVIDAHKNSVTGKVKEFLDRFSRENQGEVWSAKAIDDFQFKIFEKTKEYQHIGKELNDALQADLINASQLKGQALVDALHTGKEVWLQKQILSKNEFFRNFIAKFKPENESNFMVNAVRRSTPDEMNYVFQKAGEAKKREMMGYFVQELVERNSVMSEGGLGRTFKPLAFADDFFKMETNIQKTMPEVYPQLKDFALMCRTVADDVMKSGKGEGWWLGSSLLGQMGATYAASSQGHPVLTTAVSVPLVFPWLISKSLMNPRGWLRDWLTTGLERRLPGRVAIPTASGFTRYGIQKNIPRLNLQEEIQE